MLFFFVLCSLTVGHIVKDPPGFMWGTATAAYQIEGAVDEDGRKHSVWDVFSHTPGKTWHNETGDIADDHYHRFRDDVKLMSDLGLTHYRMSLSWPRIVPDGINVNPLGVAFYNKLINALLAVNIQPFVTLYHWDLPQALDGKNFNGWLNSSMEDYFRIYADVCFNSFGDRVKYWLTFNEPLTFCDLGYGAGVFAPGRCSNRTHCEFGNSSTEPYICTHNVLNAHAAVYKLYHDTYEPVQKGQIGITLNSDWVEPLTNSTEDKAAAQRQMEFELARWADPIWFGDYPESIRQAAGSRLPKFTSFQKDRIKGSHDFYGMNHYTSKYGYSAPPNSTMGPSTDVGAKSQVTDTDGNLIGQPADSPWLYVVPWGILKNIQWISDRYDNPPIYITENGCDVPGESSLPLDAALKDSFRVNFYSEYISQVMLAVNKGLDVRGYFAWSLMDNYEWADGYRFRFGLHYVDYNDNLKRYQKDSAKWYKGRIESGQQELPLSV